MARPLRILYPGAFYHVTSRGNERKAVFLSNRDRETFLSYMESSVERYGAVIHCFCLMGNHYHLLLETPEGNLPHIMRHINGAYTTYFNTKRRRSGHLFQGRYKAILVDKDAYARELSRYIHLNPVRAGITDRPEKYHWSSYRAFIGRDKAPGWLFLDFALSYFGEDRATSQKEYRKYVERALEREMGSPLKEFIAGTILGTEEFIREVKRKYLAGKEQDKNVPDLRKLLPRPDMDQIEAAVGAEFGEQGKFPKTVKMYLARKLTGKRLSEIGRRYAVGTSGVTEAARRLCARMERDEDLANRVWAIEEILKTCRM